MCFEGALNNLLFHKGYSKAYKKRINLNVLQHPRHCTISGPLLHISGMSWWSWTSSVGNLHANLFLSSAFSLCIHQATVWIWWKSFVGRGSCKHEKKAKEKRIHPETHHTVAMGMSTLEKLSVSYKLLIYQFGSPGILPVEVRGGFKMTSSTRISSVVWKSSTTPLFLSKLCPFLFKAGLKGQCLLVLKSKIQLKLFQFKSFLIFFPFELDFIRPWQVFGSYQPVWIDLE